MVRHGILTLAKKSPGVSIPEHSRLAPTLASTLGSRDVTAQSTLTKIKSLIISPAHKNGIKTLARVLSRRQRLRKYFY